MKVVRIFNNNILLVTDESSNEQKILWGKGIGFHLHHGDNIDPSENDKIFVQDTTSDWIRSFSNLAEEIPMDYLEASRQVIELAERCLRVKFNPFLLISLADHLYFSTQRSKDGMYSGSVLTDIRRVYYLEYQVASEALEAISHSFDVVYSPGEVGFLALHFVENEVLSAKDSERNAAARRENLTINRILEIIAENVKISDKHNVSFDRITTHLHFLMSRMDDGVQFQDTDDDNAINQSMRKRLPIVADITDKISKYLQTEHQYTLSKAEETYLMVHIYQIIKKTNIKEERDKDADTSSNSEN
ncbi:PRD domain-containing protein [Lacticaseibacillus paracasei]|uniref:PRD domain-containing protein n=1 Tax=Lacticaseibacillus paracasei TaxID=1597 RepID=UPI001F513FB4|nr:PRD domain-containing protein [Lacticaseibacillus paracasei]